MLKHSSIWKKIILVFVLWVFRDISAYIVCVTGYVVYKAFYHVSITVPAWLKCVIYIGLVVASIIIFPLLVFFLQKSKVGLICTLVYQFQVLKMYTI